MVRDEVRRHSIESQLYTQELQTYISTYLKQGYTSSELEKYLLNKGYDANSVREAIIAVNKTQYGGSLEIHQKHSSMKYLFMAVFFLIVLVVGIFLYSQNSIPYKTIISLENPQISGFEPLELLIGTTKEIGVEIKITNNKGNFVLQKYDKFKISSNYIIDLPRDLPIGTYIVDAYIQYGEEKNHQTFSFLKEEVSLSNSLTGAVIGKSSISSFTQAIQSKKSSDCLKIFNVDLKDECYFVLARDTNNDVLCSSIQKQTKKENCFLTQKLSGKNIDCSLFKTSNGLTACENIS